MSPLALGVSPVWSILNRTHFSRGLLNAETCWLAGSNFDAQSHSVISWWHPKGAKRCRRTLATWTPQSMMTLKRGLPQTGIIALCRRSRRIPGGKPATWGTSEITNVEQTTWAFWITNLVNSFQLFHLCSIPQHEEYNAPHLPHTTLYSPKTKNLLTLKISSDVVIVRRNREYREWWLKQQAIWRLDWFRLHNWIEKSRAPEDTSSDLLEELHKKIKWVSGRWFQLITCCFHHVFGMFHPKNR